MIVHSTWLPILLAIPFIGTTVAAFIRDAKAARSWALFISLLTALVGLAMIIQFPWRTAGARLDWSLASLYVPAIGFGFHLSADAISMWLMMLTALLMPISIAASFSYIQQRQQEYYTWMLAMAFTMLGVFISGDLLLFYIFFELTLIPMFFLIGIWGGSERHYAALKFFIFTFTGSMLTLATAIYLGLKYNTFDIATIVAGAQHGINGIPALTHRECWWVVLGFLSGFAVKVPLFPVHTWLPLAHTEAPTAGSVILAGLLLKLGTYGLLRLAIPIGLITAHGVSFPMLVRWIGAVCVIGIIYASLVSWVQQDIKKLVAYSSVAHLGMCVLGMMALNEIGQQGSVLYMINHGLSTGAMFLVIGMIYERYHTRDIDELSGLARIMPKLAFFFVFFTLSSIGLPGLNGYVSEVLTLLGAFTSPHLGIGFGVLGATGIILGALYMLHMVAKVIFGPLKHPTADHGEPGHAHHDGPKPDLNGREVAILVPLALAVVFLGVVPNTVLSPILKPVQDILSPIQQTVVQTNQTVPVADSRIPGSEVRDSGLDGIHPSSIVALATGN
jgi:NADH-quinone oxidoreductase subunit M